MIPLGRLYARKHIDDAQYRAGLILLELFELAEIGEVRAIDPAMEAVDGRGAFVKPITDRQMRAARKLAFVREVLAIGGSRQSPSAANPVVDDDAWYDPFGSVYWLRNY